MRAAEAFLAGSGEMATRMRALDWSATPLGEPARWPQSLRTSVSTCLNCSFPILLWWGPNLVKLYNDAYQPILGEKHPSALGRSGRDVWPEIWDTIGPMLARVMERGEAAPADDLLLLLRRHGYAEECYFSFSYSPIYDESGGVGGVFCPVIETTEKVIGARRLRTLSAIGALERASDAAAAAAACAAVIAANSADLPFGLIYLLEQESGTARLAGVAGLTQGAAAAPVEVALAAGAAAPWPVEGLPAEGLAIPEVSARFPGLPLGVWDEPPLDAFALPIAAPGEAIPAAVLIVGLSPRKRLDAAYHAFLRLLADQIGSRLADAVAFAEERRRAQALAALDEAKTAFFSNVSHEFRTPLTLMLNPLEDLRARLGPEGEAGELLDLVRRNGLRLSRLVNTLLDFSRIEAGRARAQFEPTDLAAYTAELASSFRSAIERAGLRLLVDAAPLPAPVPVDREMWEKIVLNLLSNALKFTHAGEIGVALGPAEGGRAVALTVRDTGIGIPASEVPHLFERFHRVSGAQGRSSEGSGIGLALVQELVRLHEGTISVASEPGSGSRFTVTIPLRREHPRPAGQIAAAPAAAAPAARIEPFVEEALRWLSDDPAEPGSRSIEPPADAPRLLLADDNSDMRAYLARLLREARFAVETVPDGQAALIALADRPADLVLSDVMMPRLDGFALLRAIRQDPARRQLPVILLSARAGEEARVQGLQAGADDYLVKPFIARELIARIEGALGLARLRRESEAALREGSERLRRAQRAARITDWTWDVASDAITTEGETEAVFALLPDAMPKTAAAFFACVPEPARAQLAEELAPLLSGTAARYEGEFPYRAGDGAIRWIAARAEIAEAGLDGRPSRIVGVNFDVTARRAVEQSARDGEERLRLILDSAREYAIFTISREGRITSWNRGAQRILGFTAEEALGQPFAMLFTHEDRAAGVPEREIATALADGSARNERWQCRRDGTRLFASGVTLPLGNGHGAEVLSIFRDRTEERRLQDEIARRSAELAAVLESVPVGVWIAEDPDARVIRANRHGAELLGLAPGANMSLDPGGDEPSPPYRVFRDGQARDIETLPLRRALRGEVVSGDLVEIQLADGSVRFLLNGAVPLRDFAGRIVGAVGSGADITAQVETERRLRELTATLEQRVADTLAERKVLADIIEGTDAFVQVVDPSLRLLAVNEASADAFQRLFGVRPKAGDCLSDLLAAHPARLAELKALWSRALAGEEFTLTTEGGDPASGRRHYEMKFSTLRDAGGQRIGAYQFVYDVTARVQDQARLAAAQGQLHEIQKLETVGQLTGGIAHDFNNLLTPIYGVLDVLQRRYAHEERAARMIGAAMQSAERARVLVGRLLSFARRQHLESRPVAVAGLVRGMAELIDRSLGPAIDLVLDLPEDLPMAQVDPNQLELALLNLCVNARDAMPGGGKLRIAAGRSDTGPAGLAAGQYIRLSVSDTGTGMDAETLRRATEPFYTTKGVGKGTGLGLSMVDGLAAQSGGALVLDSAPGRGTKATIFLPVAEAEASAVATPASEEAPLLSPLTIILVDDEELVRMGLGDMLRGLGHRVIEAASGAAALHLLATDPEIELLVTDYMMPSMTGVTLVREARRLRPGLPALLITGYATLDGAAADNLPRIGKPFRVRDLATMIAVAVSGHNVVPLSPPAPPGRADERA